MIRYASVCSGIEAASCAWHPLGWEPAWFAEIDAFPSAVLKHRWPEVPNLGDFTKIGAEHGPVDLLVGGTPCQSFSVAGLRGGLADDRGNLALQFLRLAARVRARWVVWENVPGVLSSGEGRDFGSILGGLAELGYGFAYRVLDAQFFGVPQRRRRVFVVGYLGDWRPPAAVLFERASLSGDPAPSRKAREDVAPRTRGGASGGGATRRVYPEVASCLGASPASTPQSPNVANGQGAVVALSFDVLNHQLGEVSHTLSARSDMQNGTALVGIRASEDGTGRGTPLVAFGWQNSASQGASASECVTPTLDKSKTPAVAFRAHMGGHPSNRMNVSGQSPTLDRNATPVVQQAAQVRRLTPRECERLQGFPDDYTLTPYRGKPASDGPRYKALGNSMAVPCMKWIGQRIAAVSA